MRLSELNSDTLILASCNHPNPTVPMLAELLPRTTVVEMATSGRLINLEHPDEFNLLVLDFLAADVTRSGA